MTLGTIVRLPDGRIGTICWNHLDGRGGVWGEHDFSRVDLASCGGFSKDLPAPEFMLRKTDVQRFFPSAECVGEEFEVLERTRTTGGSQ